MSKEISQSINNIVLDSDKHSKEDRRKQRVIRWGRGYMTCGLGKVCVISDLNGESSELWDVQGMVEQKGRAIGGFEAGTSVTDYHLSVDLFTGCDYNRLQQLILVLS